MSRAAAMPLEAEGGGARVAEGTSSSGGAPALPSPAAHYQVDAKAGVRTLSL